MSPKWQENGENTESPGRATDSIVSEYDALGALKVPFKATKAKIRLMPELPNRILLAFRGGMVGFLSTVWCLHPLLGNNIVRLRLLVPLLAIVSGMAPTKGACLRMGFMLIVSAILAVLYVAAWLAVFGTSEISLAFALVIAAFPTYAMNVRQPIQKIFPALVSVLALVQVTVPGVQERDVWHALGSATLGCVIGTFCGIIPLPFSTTIPVSSKGFCVEDTAFGELKQRLFEAVRLANHSLKGAVFSFGLTKTWGSEEETSEDEDTGSPKTPCFSTTNDSPKISSGTGLAIVSPRFRLTHAFLGDMLSMLDDQLDSIAELRIPVMWENSFRSSCGSRRWSTLLDMWSETLFRLSRVLKFMNSSLDKLNELLQEFYVSPNTEVPKETKLRQLTISYVIGCHPLAEQVVEQSCECLQKAIELSSMKFIDGESNNALKQEYSILKGMEDTVHSSMEKMNRELQCIRSEVLIHSPRFESFCRDNSELELEYELLTRLNCLYTFLFGTIRFATLTTETSSEVRQEGCNAPGFRNACSDARASILPYLTALRPNISSLKYAFKTTLAFMIAASLALIPALRSRLLFAHWAAASVAFVVSQSASLSYQQGINRLQGTAIGASIGFVVVLFGEGHVWGSAVVMAIFIGFCYAVFASGKEPLSDTARVAGFTSGIVALAEHDMNGANETALFRVLTNVLGVIILLVVTLSLWRSSASETVWKLFDQAIMHLSQCLYHGSDKLSVVTQNGEEESLSPGTVLSNVRKVLQQCNACLPHAETEPLNWSLPFRYEREGSKFRQLTVGVENATRATAAITQCGLQLKGSAPFQIAKIAKQQWCCSKHDVPFNTALLIIIAETCFINLRLMEVFGKQTSLLLKEICKVLKEGRSAKFIGASYKSLQSIERQLQKVQTSHHRVQLAFEKSLRLRIDGERKLKESSVPQSEVIRHCEQECKAIQEAYVSVKNSIDIEWVDNTYPAVEVTSEVAGEALRLLYMIFPILSFATDELYESSRSMSFRVMQIRLAVHSS